MRQLPVIALAFGFVLTCASDSYSEGPGTSGRERDVARGRTGRSQASITRTTSIPSEGITVYHTEGWKEVAGVYSNATLLSKTFSLHNGHVLPEESTGAAVATITVQVEHRRTNLIALTRLYEIAAEEKVHSTFSQISGWPAMQRRQVVTLPGEGVEDIEPRAETEPQRLIKVTTAIAAGDRVIRIEGALPVGAADSVVDEVEAIGRSVAITSIERSPAIPRTQTGRTRPGRSAPSRPPLHSTDSEHNAPPARGDFSEAVSRSEVEMAVSTDGQTVVVAAQNNFSTSTDGGHSFSAHGSIPVPNEGDASLAFGQSGRFYYGFIHFLPGCADRGCATGIMSSTDRGQTFSLLTDVVTCPSSGAQACFPDQEHIAADRFNAGPGGADQLYSTWRNFNSAGQDPNIACSTDSGMTWTAPKLVGTGFVPRVAVGQDGFVYVIYRSGTSVVMNKYNSCSSGLADQFGGPVTIATVADVPCPVPGLDRCNDGNILSSHMLAVDDTDPQHLFVAYATSTSAGSNEDVMVQDSTDGGGTWKRPQVRLNAGIAGRRFMPWVCSVNGTAQIGWYDRRSAAGVGTTDDLTDYFLGSAALDASHSLAPGCELRITQSSDAQCASGWPVAPRAARDSTSCTVRPQLAGVCSSDKSRCDFDQTVCPSNGTCQTGKGLPKYGDYNGIACAAGRVFLAFASATPPAGLSSSGIRAYFSTIVPSPSSPSGPVISDAIAQRKHLAVTGCGFDGGATLLVDGLDQPSTIDDASGGTVVLGLKLIKKNRIAPGQTVMLQMRNSNGALSNQIQFTRPN